MAKATDYVRPVGGRIDRGPRTEKLYAAEHRAVEAIKTATKELARVRGWHQDEFWTRSLPEELFHDPRALRLARELPGGARVRGLLPEEVPGRRRGGGPWLSRSRGPRTDRLLEDAAAKLERAYVEHWRAQDGDGWTVRTWADVVARHRSWMNLRAWELPRHQGPQG